MTNQEKEKAAFQSVYDSGAKDALQRTWEAVNVLGAPETARVTDFDKAYCKAIEDALRTIEELQKVQIPDDLKALYGFALKGDYRICCFDTYVGEYRPSTIPVTLQGLIERIASLEVENQTLKPESADMGQKDGRKCNRSVEQSTAISH